MCALIPPDHDVINLVTKLSQGHDPRSRYSTDMKLLHDRVPVLFDLFSQLSDFECELWPIFTALHEKVMAPFTEVNGQARVPHSLPKCEGEDVLAFFPTLPQIVDRGCYVLDNKQKNQGHSACSKKTCRVLQHSLVPGLFLLMCPHGMYIFSILSILFFLVCNSKITCGI